MAEFTTDFCFREANIIVFSAEIDQYSNYLSNIWHHGEPRLIHAVNSILLSSFKNFKAIIFSLDNDTADIACIFTDNMSENFAFYISNILHSTLKLKCRIHQLTDISPIKNIESNSSEYKIKKLIYAIFNSGSFSEQLIKQLNNNEKIALCRKIAENLIAVFGIDTVSKKSELSFYSKNQVCSCTELSEHIAYLTEYVNKHKLIKSNDVVANVIRYIENNYGKPLSLTVLARHVALSEKYLSRIFKHATGQGIANYIDDFRIKKAVDIIGSDPNIKLYTLAYQLGYESQSTFSKNFKKHIGIPPAQYAEDIKKTNRKVERL